MFDYRGDKVLVDHDSGLGWILLRTEISQRMKSHAVRPCARRRRRGCPFPGPPCRPGRRRTCVYGRNELHPSRHGHLTGLGAFGCPAPRAARVLRAPGQSGHRAPRRPRQARPSRMGARDFTSERSGVKSRSSRPPRRERGQIAQRTGGASPAARPRRGTSDCSPARVWPLGAGAAATSAALPLQTRPNRLGAGAAATSAALPCGGARFHFGIVPPG